MLTQQDGTLTLTAFWVPESAVKTVGVLMCVFHTNKGLASAVPGWSVQRCSTCPDTHTSERGTVGARRQLSLFISFLRRDSRTSWLQRGTCPTPPPHTTHGV